MAQLSPALRHRERVLAARSAAATEPGGVTTGTPYELMLRQLIEHRRTLKGIQSIERKIVAKATMLPTYQTWIDGVLSAGKGGQDDVFATALVWHIDIGDFDRALQMAVYAMQHQFSLPDQYSRNLATMLIDEFSEGFLKGKMADDPAHAADILQAVQALTDTSDAPDQARAKLHKAIALALLVIVDQADAKEIAPKLADRARQALAHLQRALTLFDGAHVKKNIEVLERRLKRLDDTK